MRTYYYNLYIKKLAGHLTKATTLALFAVNTGMAAIIDRQTSCGSNAGCYEITGAITASDATQARSLFAGKFKPTVFLNSPGGDLHAAIETGTILRSARAVGIVLPEASCESACVFLLAGATQRIVSGSIGIHRPYSSTTGHVSPAVAQENYAKVQATSRHFLEAMNLPSALYEAMVRVPPENMKYLSDHEITAFGLDAIDPVEQEVSDSYSAGKYKLSKREYLARKKLAYDSCNPDLQRTGNADQYFLCEEQILTGSVSQPPSRQYQQQPPALVSTQKQPSQQELLDQHFNTILAAHPDLDQIVNSAEFIEWEEKSLERKRITGSGTASEVINLLNEYKAQAKASFQNSAPMTSEMVDAVLGNTSPRIGGSAPSGCEIKPVMSSDDYRACGITPPGQ